MGIIKHAKEPHLGLPNFLPISRTPNDAHRTIGAGVLNMRLYEGRTRIPVLWRPDGRQRTPSFYDREKSAGTKMVEMNRYDSITAGPGERKKIATCGLRGCTAVAVASEFPDGTKRGYIQHYPPLEKQLSSLVLQIEMEVVEQLAPVRCKMVIMTPGKHAKDSNGRWVMTPELQEYVDELITRSGINNSDENMRVYSYNMSRNLGSAREQGTLMIDFGSDGETTIYTEMLPVRFGEEV